MTPDDLPDALIETLRESQRLGFFGTGDLSPAIAQALDYAELVGSDPVRVVDIGSGGGLPGLVIAWHAPHCEITFVERRQTRADHLRRIIRRLGLDVEVLCCDVAKMAGEPSWSCSIDVVTARGFGEASLTWGIARRLLRRDGRLLVSDLRSEQGKRWSMLGAEVVTQRGTVSCVVSRETSLRLHSVHPE